MTTWRFDDSISSGLSWNGAVHLRGFVCNFNTQPSLVTFPQPMIRGEAVVPTTVDVLVNRTQQYRQSVDRGNYYLTNLPIVTGAGMFK